MGLSRTIGLIPLFPYISCRWLTHGCFLAGPFISLLYIGTNGHCSQHLMNREILRSMPGQWPRGIRLERRVVCWQSFVWTRRRWNASTAALEVVLHCWLSRMRKACDKPNSHGCLAQSLLRKRTDKGRMCSGDGPSSLLLATLQASTRSAQCRLSAASIGLEHISKGPWQHRSYRTWREL